MDGGVRVWYGTGRAGPSVKCTAGTVIPAWEGSSEPGRVRPSVAQLSRSSYSALSNTLPGDRFAAITSCASSISSGTITSATLARSGRHAGG